MHMAAIRNVTGTAFVVAEFRAEENKEMHPLYRDPIVPLFLNEETKKAAERIFAAFPPIKKIVYPVHVRTRKSFGLMTRKLSVTESRKLAQFLGTLSRKKSSVASAKCPHVA
jgi:hypothetical protein